MAEEVIEAVYLQAQQKEMTISLNLEGRSSLIVRTDRIRVQQVLINMLYKAILLAPKGGEIKVSFAI